MAKAWQLLGANEDARILIIHCDDLGMNYGANAAGKHILSRGIAKSGSIMAPCAWAYDMAKWACAHPGCDIGIHITLNAEWDALKWRPIADRLAVPGLCAGDGFMVKWPWDAPGATKDQFAIEMRAQIEEVLRWGFLPSHADNHCGGAFVRSDTVGSFFELCAEFRIAPVFDAANAPPEGASVSTPGIDYFIGTLPAPSYEDLKAKTYEKLRNLPSGLGYFVLHPNDLTPEMPVITDAWLHRYWEYKLLVDDETQRVLADTGIRVTSWIELMASLGGRLR